MWWWRSAFHTLNCSEKLCFPPSCFFFLKRNFLTFKTLSNKFTSADRQNSYSIMRKHDELGDEVRSPEQGGVAGWRCEWERRRKLGKVTLDPDGWSQMGWGRVLGAALRPRWGLKASVLKTGRCQWLSSAQATCSSRAAGMPKGSPRAEDGLAKCARVLGARSPSELGQSSSGWAGH